VSGQEPPAYPEFEGLREMAEESARADGMFVDPVKMRMYQRLGRGVDWQISVLGHRRAVSEVDMHMLLLAAGQDIAPPLPDWLAGRREEQAEARRRDEAATAERIRVRDEAWKSIWSRLPATDRGGLQLFGWPAPGDVPVGSQPHLAHAGSGGGADTSGERLGDVLDRVGGSPSNLRSR
jgi:hypothetical protein